MLRILSHFLVPFLAMGLSAQGELDARLDAVREFVRYFKKAKQEALQVEAVLTLKGNECVPAADQLLKLLKHKQGAVQKAALLVLATYKESATFQKLMDKLPDERDVVNAAVTIKVLGRSKIVAAIPSIEAAASKGRVGSSVKYEAARAFMSIGHPGTLGLLAQFLTDRAPLVRLAASLPEM